MNKIILITLGTSLLIQGCAGYSSRTDSSEIFGKMTIINENGMDITAFCGADIDKNRIFVQMADVGENVVRQITCMPGQYLYRIKSGPMMVSVPADNLAVYFGDITVKLKAYGYDVVIEDNQARSSQFYRGSKPIKKSLLNVGNTEKGWSKASLDDAGNQKAN
jgi:hypothetical protein